MVFHTGIFAFSSPIEILANCKGQCDETSVPLMVEWSTNGDTILRKTRKDESITTYVYIEKFRPFGSYEVEDAIGCSFQSHAPNEQRNQDNVREKSSEVSHFAWWCHLQNKKRTKRKSVKDYWRWSETLFFLRLSWGWHKWESMPAEDTGTVSNRANRFHRRSSQFSWLLPHFNSRTMN